MRIPSTLVLLLAVVAPFTGCADNGPAYLPPIDASFEGSTRIHAENLNSFFGETCSLESVDGLPVRSRSYSYGDDWVFLSPGRHTVELYFLSAANRYVRYYSRGTLNDYFQGGHKYVFTLERSSGFNFNLPYVLVLEDQTAEKKTYFPKDKPQGTPVNPFK